MDFQRNSNGMLGFGIDESGVVRKVDGLAKTTGLQVHSRILQVCVTNIIFVYIHACTYQKSQIHLILHKHTYAHSA